MYILYKNDNESLAFESRWNSTETSMINFSARNQDQPTLISLSGHWCLVYIKSTVKVLAHTLDDRRVITQLAKDTICRMQYTKIVFN